MFLHPSLWPQSSLDQRVLGVLNCHQDLSYGPPHLQTVKKKINRHAEQIAPGTALYTVITARRPLPLGNSGEESETLLMLPAVFIMQTQMNTKHQWKTLQWKTATTKGWNTQSVKIITRINALFIGNLDYVLILNNPFTFSIVLNVSVSR